MNPIDILIEYFNTAGWPLDVNRRKLIDRESVVSTKDDNIKIIKIERHRSVLSAMYTPGLPMAAYEVYWMRYAVNLKSKEVEELEEKVGEIVVDTAELVSVELDYEHLGLKIEPLESDCSSYKISEDVSKESKIISSYQEAELFGLSLCPMREEFFKDCLDSHVDTHEIHPELAKKLLVDYRKSLDYQMKEKIKDLWDDRDKE